MGKGKKRSNPGVGVDFRKVKHKVGRKLPKAQNDTKTDFQSRSINLPSQSVAKDRTGAAVSDHNLTLEELVSQLGHHNPRTRSNALTGLQQLITSHPTHATRHAALLLEALAAHISDGDQAVRTALLSTLRSAVLPAVGPAVLTPFLPMLMAHLSAALTHLSADVRYDALAVLEAITEAAPQLMTADQHLQSALAHYSSLLSRANRGKSVKSQALSGLSRTLSSLERFLTAAMAATAAAGTGNSGGSGTAAVSDSSVGGPLLCARATVPAAKASIPLPTAADILQLYSPGSGQSLQQQQQQQQLGRSSPATSLQHQTLQLLNILFDCWSEAAPGSLNSTPESESAQVLVHILACSKLLLQHMSPAQLTATSGTDSVTSANIDLNSSLDSTARGELCAVGLTGQSRSVCEVEAAAAVVLPRVLGVFPAPDAAASMTAQLQQLLQRFNLLSMQIITLFIACGVQWPVLTNHPAAAAAAAAAAGNNPDGVNVAGSEKVVAGKKNGKGSSSSSMKGQLMAHIGWQDRFVSFLSDAVAAGASDSNTSSTLEPSIAGTKQEASKKQLLSNPASSSGSSSSTLVALQCLQQLMPQMPRQQRQPLLLALSQHLSPQQQHRQQQQQRQQQQAKLSSSTADIGSPISLACLQLQLQLLLACLSDGCDDPQQESVIAFWVAAAPKLLWECGSSKPQCSKLLLLLLYHAARLALPGSLVQQQLLQVQAQLAPLFATALPAAAAAAAGPAKRKSHTGASAQNAGTAAIPVMLGPLVSLPGSLQCLAFDALALHTQLQQPLLRAAALSCRLSSFTDAAVSRLLDCMLFAAGRRIAPELFLSFAATLLSPAPAGGYVDKATGKQLYAGFRRHHLLTDVICRCLHSYGPLGASLTALMPLLLHQWQSQSSSGAADADVQAGDVTAVRCCSYSCIILATLALSCFDPSDSQCAGAGVTSCRSDDDVSSESLTALPDSIKQHLPAVLASYCISSIQDLSNADGENTSNAAEKASDLKTKQATVALSSKDMECLRVEVVEQCTSLVLPLLTAESELMLMQFLDQMVSWVMHDTADASEASHAAVASGTAVPSSTSSRVDAIAAIICLLGTLLQCQGLRGSFIQHKQQLEQLLGRLGAKVQRLQQCGQVPAMYAQVQNMQAAVELLC